MPPPVKVHQVTPELLVLNPTPEEYAEFVREHTYNLLDLSRKVRRTDTRSKIEALIYLLHLAHYEASDILNLGVIIEQPKPKDVVRQSRDAR